ncbi:ATP-binding protein [Roseateles oligotrophus]|uniref:histidine kinase n=1 Tax=Roseateles oligotrophus TaxID=1769250 RepID=A0ABT2YJN4_9BURK|nr:ATP-binding protein [Roseateles oligotrophus]MCV2370274.1 PAS domain S-box protein [Roseateles oligotrophus]
MLKTFFRSNALTLRVTLGGLAILLAGLWSLAWFAHRLINQDAMAALSAQQLSTAAMIAANIDDDYQLRQNVLAKIAGTIAAELPQGPAAVVAFLDQRTMLHDLFSGGVLVLDAEGAVIGDSKHADWAGQNFSAMDEIGRAMRDGLPVVGRPIARPTQAATGISITQPIRNQTGRAIGAITGMSDLFAANFLRSLSSQQYGNSGGYQLVDRRRHQSIALPNASPAQARLPAPSVSPVLDQFISGVGGSGIFVNSAGVEVLASAKPLANPNWVVIAWLPTEEAFAPLHLMQRRIVRASMLLSLLACGMILWLLRRQLRPLQQAVAQLDRTVAAPVSPAPLLLEGDDEVGRVAAAFNRQLALLRQKDADLQRSEFRWRFAIEGSGAGLWDWDLRSGRVFFSPRLLEMLGLPAEPAERDEAEWEALLHPDDWASTSAHLLDYQQGRCPIYLAEQRLRCADGSYKPCFNRGLAAERDGSGRPLRMIGTYSDLSEQKAHESRLRDLLRFEDSILQVAPYAIIAVGPDGLISHFNGGAEQMLGYRADEVIGQHDLTLLHDPLELAAAGQAQASEVGSAPQRAIEPLVAASRQGGVHQREWTLRRKDGSQLAVLVSSVQLRADDGREAGFLGLAVDITQSKAAAQQLELALQRAEAATRAKSNFLAHMSHEIRTPMNAILGSASLLELDGLTPGQLGHLQVMRHSGRLLLALLDDVLDFSKIEAGHLLFVMQPFAPSKLFEDLAGVVAVMAAGKALEINFELADDLPPLLVGDARRLEQILNNLLGNAVKFTAQGAISLRVQCQQQVAGQVRLQFEVIDTGIGIAADQIEAIFEAFEQAEGGATTQRFGGTGLGLTICRQLVEMMGGSIGVESVEGQGSRFHFTALFALPVADAQARSSAAAPDIGRLQGRRVLMVEDNAFNRDVLEAMLHRFGIEVDVAVDGPDGLECFEVGCPYDAVLMDLHMPGLDGFECSRRIRLLPMGEAVPIIAITANVLAGTAQDCLAAGMNAVLNKPVEPHLLSQTLLDWMANGPVGPGVIEADEGEEQAEAAPPAAADRLPDALPGIDAERASVWSNGSARILADMLTRVLADCAGEPARIARCMAAGDPSGAARICHDLSGMAAAVGASSLCAAARQLHGELRAGRVDSSLARGALADIEAEFPLLRLSQRLLQQQVEAA